MSKNSKVELQDQLIHKKEFQLSIEQLSKICAYDNQFKASQAWKDGDPPLQYKDQILSSKIIIEEFGGIEAIAKGLDSNIGEGPKGIPGSHQDEQHRKDFYGINAFPPPKIKNICELVAENFEDPINVVLCAAALVSVIIGIAKEGFPEGLTEGLSIMIALVIIIVVNSANNYASERQLAKMVELADEGEIAVYRGSNDTTTIPNSELVVGDVFEFSFGIKLPADCILIEGQNVVCDEVELTGEPHGIDKVPVTEENYREGAMSSMLAKSLVQSGFGKALVVAVGPNTVAGIISSKTMKPSEPTLLQKKLETIASKIGNVGIGCAILTFISLIVRDALEMYKILPCGCQNLLVCEEQQNCQPLTFELTLKNRLWLDILDTIIIAISVIVCAIPEGLPLAVTISLSYSSQKMKDLNNLVRKLASSETMGSATHICSDKTGTLTQNKMTVMGCSALNRIWYDLGDKSDPKKLNLPKAVSDATNAQQVGGTKVWQLMFQSIMWNSSARIEIDSEAKQGGEQYCTKGNVTEQGLINFFLRNLGGQACKDLMKQKEEILLQTIQFTSGRKRASVVVRDPSKAGTDREVRVYCKGGPEFLFPFTTRVVGEGAAVKSMSDRAQIPNEMLFDNEAGGQDTYEGLLQRAVKKFAEKAYRTILITYRDLSMKEFEQLKAANNNFETEEDQAVLEQELVALAIFGIEDPLRDTIVDSIQQCHEAGITVIMCTGDNIDTATAISKNAGIISEADVKDKGKKYVCMTGKDFREEVGAELVEIPDPSDKTGKTTKQGVKNLKKFKEIQQQLRVLARSSPLDKLILVTGLQQCEAVVAVTGDGTNDAPALTQADVGFSMGITGTDVAKGASDIILLDDNFSSIIVALKYGRNVYDNVRKFLQFQLSVNIVAMAIVFFGSVILKDSPLNAVQMLWVNLIMDTLGALALATEPPADEILKRKPYKKDNPIVTENMWRNIFGHAVFQICVLGAVIFASPGLLCQNYWTRCTLKDSTGCQLYNPFFTTESYHNNETLDYWSSLNVTQASFDQTELLKFSCNYQEYNFQSTLENPKFACNTQNIILPSNVILSQTKQPTEKLVHYTLVFQVFVFLQLFNLINARKIELGEFNVFSGFFNNPLFLIIMLFTITIQILLVKFGGKAVKTYPLDMNRNFICIGIGSLSLIWGLIVKTLPLKMFQCIKLDETPMEEEELSLPQALKKSATIRKGSTVKSNPKTSIQ